MRVFHVLFLLLLFVAPSLQAAVADWVIFSYNRPIQLYALLESAEALMTGVGETHVIFRADSDAFFQGYEKVAHDFGYVKFHKQGSDPKADFKPLTMMATFNTPSDYVIFAVDDIIVKDYVNLSDSIDLMERGHAYAFYLRMGRSLNRCYSMNQKQDLPPMREVGPGAFGWTFAEGIHDWNYPHSVDMTLFRKKEIRENFERLDFTSPNTLEGRWAAEAGPISHRTGLCYASTKIVNLPLNRVQSTHQNRHMDLYSAEELLAVFNGGEKIDVAPLFQMENLSAHTEYEPTFIERTPATKYKPETSSQDDL